MKNRTIKPVLCGRRLRIWINERGFLAWDSDNLTSRRAAQRQGEALLDVWDEGGFGPDARIVDPDGSATVRGVRILSPAVATGFIVKKLAARRWQVVAFAADRGIST